MNLLAHAYLGFDDVALVTGQIAGDFVKGPDLSAYPPDIQNGIRMHRKLDVWTDRHPVFKRSCARFPKERRRVAGIIVDLAYDHSLARHWSHYCHTDLVNYADFLYVSLEKFRSDLPADMNGFINRVPEVGLFEGYRDIQGLERAVRFVESRFKRTGLFEGVMAEIDAVLPEIDQDFAEFFPAAIRHAATLAPQSEQIKIYGDVQQSIPKTEVFLR